jgi:LmbE family N-acetylglucosaminyl deacetylase
MKGKIVLAIGAHPDDIDIRAGGSIAKWIEEGAIVYYLVCTDGSRGSDHPQMTHKKLVRIRQKEQLDSAKVLGLKKVFFLTHTDTQLRADIKLKRDIVEIIRKVKPNIVITMDLTHFYTAQYPEDMSFVNHTDHREATIAAMDAVFPLSRDRLTFPEHEKKGLRPHKTEEILLACLDKKDFIVDISRTFDRKIKALSMHKSQFTDFEKTKKRVENRAKFWGNKIGSKFAENFIRIKFE